MDTDVLIVGAGPTGLMLANQLVRRGVRVTIVDRHAGPAEQTRAMAVHARTLEIYAKLGLAERAVDLGRRGDGGNVWAQGVLKARLALGEMGRGTSAFPYVLMLGQDENERILGEHLNAQGVAVRWRTELTALEQEPRRVTATLKYPDGRVGKISAAYVAGCDGGHSTVRALNGVEFVGAAYEHVFFVADTEATGPMVQGELNIYLWRDGFHLFFPMRGQDRWRVIGILPERLRGKDGVAFADVERDVRRESGAHVEFKKCDWFSTYKIHHRRAERFQNGRCFLLGDAAHVHSPMGGQGMNTGLQDAYNLAWKLALVVGGRASSTLLKSYEAERIPVANRLLETTDRAFRLIVSKSWLAGVFRTRVFAKIAAFAMSRRATRRIAFATLSQTGIHYRGSPLARTLAGLPRTAPQAGDRFPWLNVALRTGGPIEDLYEQLDDTRFNLVLVGQPGPDSGLDDLRDIVRAHALAADGPNERELARAGVPAPSFYLLRPDGHVGLAGGQFDAAAVREYLARIGFAVASPIRHGHPVELSL
jgi:2-polyprenyl-6-methoxyphenol hydroxylase-like FAD-dependent oxidoreductase